MHQFGAWNEDGAKKIDIGSTDSRDWRDTLHKWLIILLLLSTIFCRGGANAENGSSEPKEVLAVGSSEPEKVLAVGSSEPKEVLAVGSSEPKEVLAVGSSEPKEVLAVGSSEPEKVLAVGSSEPEKVLAVGSSEPKEVLAVGSSEPKEVLAVGSSEPKEVLVVGSSEPKEVLVVGSSEPKEVLVVGSSQQKKSVGSNPEKPMSFDSSQLEAMKFIGSKFNSDIASILEMEKGGESGKIIVDILKDNYLLDKFFDETLTNILINLIGYYSQKGTKFECTIKDIINLLGNGMLADVLPEDPGCGRKAAFAEWLLECHGISANIIVAPNFFGNNLGHAWVEVLAPQNETYYVDLSRRQGYIVVDEAYKVRSGGKIKNDYWVFEDIRSAASAYGIRKFAWWCTEWGTVCLGNTSCKIGGM